MSLIEWTYRSVILISPRLTVLGVVMQLLPALKSYRRSNCCLFLVGVFVGVFVFWSLELRGSFGQTAIGRLEAVEHVYFHAHNESDHYAGNPMPHYFAD